MKSNLEKIAAYQAIMPKKQGESICHSAVLECEYGSQTCVLNLERSHGRYIGNNAQIDKKDGKNVNFGYCSKLNEPCRARLSDWYHANEEDLMFDERTLKMEPSVQMDSGFMVCSRGYAIVQAVTSGQTIGMPSSWDSRNNVYITKDNKYIVVDGVNFEIYNPEPKRELHFVNPEEWYEVDTWKCEKMEFDAAKAILGIFSSSLGIKGVELVDGHNDYPTTNGGIKNYKQKISFSADVQIVNNVLQVIADAIEYTYVKFIFQVSNLRNYRVTILGGTKSDTTKYNDYPMYNCRYSFLSNIATGIYYYKSKEALEQTVGEAIKDVTANIKKNESFSKLLVAEEELSLQNNEYYDIELYLNSKRQNQQYQVYIYTDADSNISQKLITYPNEGLYLVKHTPTNMFNLFPKRRDLIDMMDDLIIKSINLDFSNTFWKLCEQVLRDYNNKTMGSSIANPSDAMKAPMSELCENVWKKIQKK